MYWFVGLGVVGVVGGYLVYNYYIDPYVRLTGPLGMIRYKRRSEVSPAELEFERKV